MWIRTTCYTDLAGGLYNSRSKDFSRTLQVILFLLVYMGDGFGLEDPFVWTNACHSFVLAHNVYNVIFDCIWYFLPIRTKFSL